MVVFLSIMLIIVSAMSIYFSTKCHKLNGELDDYSLRINCIEERHRRELLYEQQRTEEAYLKLKMNIKRVDVRNRDAFKLRTFEKLTEEIYNPDIVPELLDRRMEMYDKVFGKPKDEDE